LIIDECLVIYTYLLEYYGSAVGWADIVLIDYW